MADWRPAIMKNYAWTTGTCCKRRTQCESRDFGPGAAPWAHHTLFYRAVTSLDLVNCPRRLLSRTSKRSAEGYMNELQLPLMIAINQK